MAEKKTTETKKGNAALDAVMSQIRKEFGEMAIMRLGDQEVKEIPVISTGAVSLDMALGVGGLPRGRIVECYGQESSGKTTLALHVVANAQKAGGVAAFIDAEHALDPTYAKKIGVNLDDLIVGTRLIIELKHCDKLAPVHVAQLINYLCTTGIEHGLLINFGSPKFEIVKRIYTKKQPQGEPLT